MHEFGIVSDMVAQLLRQLQGRKIREIHALRFRRGSTFSTEALEQAYQDKGYGAVQVTLPEQVLEKGAIRFRVIEARIRKIAVEGAQFHDEANIRASVPELKEGATPLLRDIATQLRAANENPSKQTTLLMKPGEKEGVVDATIKVADDKTQRMFVTLDNTGTRETGNYRLGVGYQHANLFNLDHVLTLQYLTSPEKIDDVTVVGAGYRIPLYQWGDTLDIIAGYSDVTALNVQNLGIDTLGKGSNLGLRYNQFLPRVGEGYEQKLVYGLDYRAFQANVLLNGAVAQVVPDITLHPVSLTYAGTWKLRAAEIGFYLTGFRNLPGGNDGGTGTFEALRGGNPAAGIPAARADYTILRYGASYNRGLGEDWLLRVGLTGQETEDARGPYEQIGAGGAASVRGFREREIFNDKGYQGNLEIHTPAWAGSMGEAKFQLRGLAFFDFASLSRNHPLPAETVRESISSYGLGLRFSLGTGLSARLDMARVENPGGVQSRGDTSAHFGVAYVRAF